MSSQVAALGGVPDRFEIMRELGAGGFGRVYLARDREHGELVALKLLARGDPQALKRFKTEFRSLANLVHANLVSLFELHQPHDGTAGWFFTMELVDGRPFTEFLRPEPGFTSPHPSLTMTRAPRHMDDDMSVSAAVSAPVATLSDSGQPGFARPSASLSEDGQPGFARPSASLSEDGQPGFARPSATIDTADPQDWSALEGRLLRSPDRRHLPGESLAASAPRRSPESTDDATPEAPAGLPQTTHLTPLSIPQAFFGIEPPDPATAAFWASLRPEPGTGTDFVLDGPDGPARRSRLEDCFGQLVDALAWLHTSGHLHRDIKPSNVLVDGRGTVKLLDFGLVARLFDGVERQTELLVGTPAFMAPELCAGLPASPASDWYSVGVMLYLVLTGHLPFSGDARAVVLAKQSIPVRRPSELAQTPPELDTLCMALLAINPLERPDASVLRRAFESANASRATGLENYVRAPSDIFVGRRAEVARLAAVVASGGAATRVALVSAPSGFGKTALVRHVLRELVKGAHEPEVILLQSRCFERGTVRYRALDGAIDDLAGVLGAMAPNTREELLPAGLDRDALTRLFPVLALAPISTSPADPVDLRRRASIALRELFSAVARRHHLVVAVDDAQWADEDSVPLVAELMRQCDARWVFAFRAEARETSPFLMALTRDLLPRLSPDAVESIALEPLPAAEAEALAREALEDWRAPPDPVRARQIALEAAGHPLLISELARVDRAVPTGASGAPSLDALLAARVNELPARCHAALSLVAVAGEPISPRLLRVAVGADSSDLNRLEREHLIATRPGGDGELAVCWHDRVRESTLALLSPEQRATRHHELAQSAERIEQDDPFFLGAHYGSAVAAWLDGLAPPSGVSLAEVFGAALTWGWSAIERARSTLAFDRAASVAGSLVELCHRAVRHGGPLTAAELATAFANTFGDLKTLALARAESLVNAGRGVLAAQAFERAATEAKDEVERRRIELKAAEQYLFAGAFGEGEATIRRVLGRAGLGVAQGVPGAMASFLWESLRMRVRGLRYAQVAEDTVAAERLALIDTLWSATIGLSMAWPLGSQAFQQRHLRHALEAGEPRRVARALSIELAFSGLAGGKNAAVSQRLSTLVHDVAAQLAHPYPKAFATMSDGGVHWLCGRWAAAKDAAERSLEVYRRDCVGVTWEKDTSEFLVLSGLAHMGDLNALMVRTDEVLTDAVERGDLYLETQIRTRFVPLLALRAGDPVGARAGIDVALSRWSGSGFQIVHYWALVNRVNAWLYEGRPTEAWAELARREGLVKRSFLLMGQYYRIQWHELRAKVGLALHRVGERGAIDGERLARRSQRALAKERMPWSDPMALLLDAALSGSADTFARAADGFRKADMALHASAAESGAARARGGAGTEVHAELARLGVAEPDRLLAMFLPSAGPRSV